MLFLVSHLWKKSVQSLEKSFGIEKDETIQSIYGMDTVSRAFFLHLGDFMWWLGHIPSRADPDMQMKKDHRNEGCLCVSARVDDFLL